MPFCSFAPIDVLAFHAMMMSMNVHSTFERHHDVDDAVMMIVYDCFFRRLSNANDGCYYDDIDSRM